MTKTEVRKEWEARVVAFRASGQSAPKWCAAHDLKPHQLWYWVRKFESAKVGHSSSPKWLPIEVAEPPSDSESSLLIRIGQTAIEVKPGFNPTLLSNIVRVLTELC